MLPRITFLLLLVVLLFGAALMTVPIKMLTEQLAVQLPPNAVTLSGSLSEGNGRINPPNPSLAPFSPFAVYWQWCPSSGLTAWCVSAKSLAVDAHIEGVLTIWLDHITLSESKLFANLTRMRLLPKGLFAKAIGAKLRGNITKASIAYDDFFPREVEANLTLNNLRISDIKLGNYRAVLRSDEKSTLSIRGQGRGGDIKNLNGKLLLTPLAKLTFDKAASKKARVGYRYELNANSNNPLLKGMLAIAGKRSNSGGYVMGGKGKW